MHDIDTDEFERRVWELHSARKVFIESGLTKNISHAYAAYRLILLDDEERKLSREVLGSSVDGLVPGSIISKLRPACPVCGHQTLLRAIYAAKGPANVHGWRTCWECSHCEYEKYSLMSVKEWAVELTKSNG